MAPGLSPGCGQDVRDHQDLLPLSMQPRQRSQEGFHLHCQRVAPVDHEQRPKSDHLSKSERISRPITRLLQQEPTMFKKLLRKLKLGRGAAAVIDTVASQALDKATGGLASDVEALVKKRKAK